MPVARRQSPKAPETKVSAEQKLQALRQRQNELMDAISSHQHAIHDLQRRMREVDAEMLELQVSGPKLVLLKTGRHAPQS